MNDQLNRQLLLDEVVLLRQSLKTLSLSVVKCQKIGNKQSYSFEEMESFDSLTSKFNRTADIFTQKVIRTLWALLHEPYLPFIDLMNNAEKLEIIKKADQLMEIRDIRNQIAHEYIPEAITELVPDVIKYSHLLVENIEQSFLFLRKRGWIDTEEPH